MRGRGRKASSLIAPAFFALAVVCLILGYNGDPSFVTFGAAFFAIGMAFVAKGGPRRRRGPQGGR